MSRVLTLLRPWFLIAFTALAANETKDTATVERVGWQAGPTTRGTLSLVWSCAITIFACTWTVTHLNVPGCCDTAPEKLFRRIKWMSINIIFPEFIFSKAICDLRQALDELRQFGQNLPNIKSETTTRTTEDAKVNYERSWAVAYPPYPNILYRCLWLDPPLPEVTTPLNAETEDLGLYQRLRQTQSQGREQDSLAQSIPLASLERPDEAETTNNVSRETSLSRNHARGLIEETPMPKSGHGKDSSATKPEQHEVSGAATVFQTRTWTIVHSYYAQMGGIRRTHNYSDSWGLITATKLTSQFRWTRFLDHPLKHLELSRQDIEDKSKADWFLKGLAMCQILWLVLNVVVRGRVCPSRSSRLLPLRLL